MAKLLLLMGLIPVFVSFVARKFLSDRVVRKEGEEEVSISGRQMVDRVLTKGKAGGVDIQEKKRPFMVLGLNRLVISPSLCESKQARDVAEAGILAGLVIIAQRQEKVVGWRLWAVKFGSAMPAFTTIVMAFAMVMGRLSATLCFGVIAASLGLATAFLWFTLPVERAAAGTVAEMLEDTAIMPRRSEGEKMATLVRALGWRRIVPGAIAWITGK